MKILGKIAIAFILIFSICAVIMGNLASNERVIDNVAFTRYVDGEAVVVQQIDDTVRISFVNKQGIIKKKLSIDNTDSGRLMSVVDIAANSDGNVYLLADYYDLYTGKYLNQELILYDASRLFMKKRQSHSLSKDDFRYRFVSLSSSLTLMAVNSDETMLIRESYEPATVLGKKDLQPKTTRSYELDAKEGISAVTAAGSNIAYMTRSGKVFYAEENAKSYEVYPARPLEKLMYPTFIAPKDTEAIYMGEQESGDFLTLTLADGGIDVIKSGTEPFPGIQAYTPKNIVQMDYSSPQDFVGAVKNSTGHTDLLLSVGGEMSAISRIAPPVYIAIFNFIFEFFLWAASLFAIFGVGYLIYRSLKNGRTILLKLMAATIPLVTVALVVFGVFVSNVYKSSVEQSFQKQVVDEGNLLMALFGTESFNEIEFPYHYSSEAYSYLKKQMATREVFTRTAYFEQSELYFGVDVDFPCFYPLDRLMNSTVYEMYKNAAFTGKVQTGMVEDSHGKRLVAVTPIGGVSGNTVYLLESGIPIANLDRYTTSFILSYAVIAVLFIVLVTAVLVVVFSGTLKPLKIIQSGLEEFSKGNRTVRLENNTKDELSDIIRVFNKMSNDIDTQIYNLNQISESYYRFIPSMVPSIMGKSNIGELRLGSHVKKEFHILAATLSFHSGQLSATQEQALINQFFNIISTVAAKHSAVLVADSADLCRVNIICPEGANTAVDIALESLVEIDHINTSLPMQTQLESLFLVHKTDVFYGIFGNNDRYIPVMLSEELKTLRKPQNERLLSEFSCRLIITGAAFEDIKEDSYYSRFIGYIGGTKDKRLMLYDFYDSFPAEQIRKIEDTKQTFNKAMELYLQERYYDAKNLFAIVIRENQFDNVGRHYIFKCESKLHENNN